MCHNFLTDPAGWTRALRDREIPSILPIAAIEDNRKRKKRGTNWDGTHGEDKRDPRENTIDRDLQARGTNWDNSPSRDDARLKRRETNWDNTYNKDMTLDAAQKRKIADPHGTGSTKSRARGITWDNSFGKDKRNPLGPKVGQGGKPKKLYGNDWEFSRLIRSMHTTLATRTGGKQVSGDTLIPVQQGDCASCVLKKFVKRIHPRGSWFIAKGQSLTLPGERNRVRRAEESQHVIAVASSKPAALSAKFRPAGGCVNGLIKRWFTPINPKAASETLKERVKRTEDSKGGIGADSEKPNGGVPMPLCVHCWYRRVKRCVA
ncbi:MAG: hypothetical protein Q9209_007412 [Squamulea sp. 1 TL-2023]